MGKLESSPLVSLRVYLFGISVKERPRFDVFVGEVLRVYRLAWEGMGCPAKAVTY